MKAQFSGCLPLQCLNGGYSLVGSNQRLENNKLLWLAWLSAFKYGTVTVLSVQFMNHNYFYFILSYNITIFIRPWKDGTYYGMALSVRLQPFTIACERDNLKTACQIDFTF